MPTAALRPCAQPGCGELVPRGRCSLHTKEQDERRRGAETWRHVKGARSGTIDIYQSARWKRLQARVLREANYLCECEECKQRPVGEPANTVDHIIAVRDAPSLAFERSNLRAMSQSHHSRRTIGDVVHRPR
jgi:5-methylcytosine-specific restriction endonuclease McrA